MSRDVGSPVEPQLPSTFKYTASWGIPSPKSSIRVPFFTYTYSKQSQPILLALNQNVITYHRPTNKPPAAGACPLLNRVRDLLLHRILEHNPASPASHASRIHLNILEQLFVPDNAWMDRLWPAECCNGLSRVEKCRWYSKDPVWMGNSTYPRALRVWTYGKF